MLDKPLLANNKNATFARWATLGILLGSFAVQLYHLDTRTFFGDEFYSLAESIAPGLNPNGLIYFLLMNIWARFGDSEFWLRVPSIVFGILSVSVAYSWSKIQAPRISLPLMLLLGTSAFLVAYSQQFRFYTFFLFATVLIYWTFFVCLRNPSRRNLAVLILANGLALGAHFFGLLLILIEMMTAFLLTQRIARRAKIFLGFAVLASGIALLVIPQIRQAGYYIVSVLTNPYGTPEYVASRGLSLSAVAKIPLTFFFFIFGESVYPLHLWLVVPGVIFFGAAAVLGIVYLKRYPQMFVFVITAFVLGLGLLYLVFDPLAPPTLQGAAPRYLIFLLPLFYLVVAAGTLFAKTRWLLLPLLLINSAGLALYWQGDWSYTDDLVNWRAVGQRVAEYSNAHTDVVADGRAYELTKRYVASQAPPYKLSEYVPRAETERIVLLTNDFHAERRADADAFLQNVASDFSISATWGQFPAFLYILTRRTQPGENVLVDAQTGRVETMPELYGLEFQDMRLPLQAKVDGNSIALPGPFVLDKNKSPRVFPVAQPTNAQTLWLLSQYIGIRKGANTQVAALRVLYDDGTHAEMPIRIGAETAAWDGECYTPCESVASWRKRAALLGTSAYPDSWREFDAHIFGVPLELNPNARVTQMELLNAQDTGKLYVWGIVLR